MSQHLTLEVSVRDPDMGPGALRRSGQVPAVVYGRKRTATSIQFDAASGGRLVAQAGFSQLVALAIPDRETPELTLIRDVQRDPLSRALLHVDFYAVVMDEKVSTEIPLVQVGEAPVMELGGTIIPILEVLEIECLPLDMPQAIEVDISGLTDFGDHITVADLVIPEGVDVLAEPDTDVIRVSAPHIEAAEEEEEGLEGEEGAEGEAAEGEQAAEESDEDA